MDLFVLCFDNPRRIDYDSEKYGQYCVVLDVYSDYYEAFHQMVLLSKIYSDTPIHIERKKLISRD